MSCFPILEGFVKRLSFCLDIPSSVRQDISNSSKINLLLFHVFLVHTPFFGNGQFGVSSDSLGYLRTVLGIFGQFGVSSDDLFSLKSIMSKPMTSYTSIGCQWSKLKIV